MTYYSKNNKNTLKNVGFKGKFKYKQGIHYNNIPNTEL